MKKIKIITSIAALCCMLFSMNNAMAQTIQVTQGSTHKYSVTPDPTTANFTYHWSVTSGGTTSTLGTTATNDITWTGTPGSSYTITVYPEDNTTHCLGNNQTQLIQIVGMGITWATLSGTECPKTDNQTGDFSIQANYTGISGAWSFKYKIDNGSETSVSVASGTTSTVSITGFANASSTATATHTITITSITTPDGLTVAYDGTETDAANHKYTVTVNPTPTIGGISQVN